MSNYATRSEFKNETGTVTSKLTEKAALASLKSEVHKLDIDEWESTLADLSILTNLVKNEAVKKTV